MRFIRFVVGQAHPGSGVEEGVFRLAYALKRSARVGAADLAVLTAALAWFDEHLPAPERFNRSKSKGFYRRNTRGIAWFKDTATEHLARMHQITAVLERNGHPVTMLSEARVGYVVHEDAHQVVAEPFADTRTR